MKLVQQKYFLFANSWNLRTTSVLFFGQTMNYQIWDQRKFFGFSWLWGWVVLLVMKTQIPFFTNSIWAGLLCIVVVDADIDVDYNILMIMLNLILLVKIPIWERRIFLVSFVWIFSSKTCDVETDYVYYDERYKRLWYWHSKWITTFKANIINASCDI